MGFAKPIDPISRIKERINITEIVHSHCQCVGGKVERKLEDSETEEELICLYFLLLTHVEMHSLIDQVIRKTYDETCALILRRLKWEDEQ